MLTRANLGRCSPNLGVHAPGPQPPGGGDLLSLRSWNILQPRFLRVAAQVVFFLSNVLPTFHPRDHVFKALSVCFTVGVIVFHGPLQFLTLRFRHQRSPFLVGLRVCVHVRGQFPGVGGPAWAL